MKYGQQFRLQIGQTRLMNPSTSLADDGGEGVRRRHPVGLDHPRVVRARLEHELAAARAAGLQIDERPDLRRPHVLGDEAVAALQFQDRQDALLFQVMF